MQENILQEYLNKFGEKSLNNLKWEGIIRVSSGGGINVSIDNPRYAESGPNKLFLIRSGGISESKDDYTFKFWLELFTKDESGRENAGCSIWANDKNLLDLIILALNNCGGKSISEILSIKIKDLLK